MSHALQLRAALVKKINQIGDIGDIDRIGIVDVGRPHRKGLGSIAIKVIYESGNITDIDNLAAVGVTARETGTNHPGSQAGNVFECRTGEEGLIYVILDRLD